MNVLDREDLDTESYTYFLDLDNDGVSEKVEVKNYQSVLAIELYKNDGSYIDNWVLTDKRACLSRLMYGDYDQNGYMELYVFTEKNDSIYINWLEPLNGRTWKKEKTAVCTLHKIKDKCDYTITNVGLYDLNNDGNKEVVFMVNMGYGLKPRSLFAMDISNREIKTSPKSFAAIKGPVYVMDIDGDGLKEITYRTGATANIAGNLKVPYSDNSAWMFVHDNNLNFKFPPVEFPGETKAVQTVPFEIKGTYYLFSLVYDPRSPAQPHQLLVYSNSGKFIKEIDLGGIGALDEPLSLFYVPAGSKSILFVINALKGIIYKLNDDFSLQRITSLNEKISSFFIDDVDGDGKKELMFYKYMSKKICISDMDFKHLSEVSINPNISNDVYQIGVYKSAKNNNFEIYGQVGWSVIKLELIKIPFYYNTLLFVTIYLGIFFVVFSAQKIQAINLSRKKKVESRINELQLKSTLSQLDPHFAFNVINTISTSILKDKKEKANDYLVGFSRLLRTSLEYSDKISWPVEKEIKFVRDYLNLQKARFDKVFQYKLDIDETVNQSVQIPKMIVQGYVENAIKHGLRPKGADGLLTIKVQQNNRSILIVIEDNGIGRAESLKSKRTSGTGKGLKLNSELIDLHNKLMNTSIRVHVDDLTGPDNRPLGTRVSVDIPVKD